MTTPDDGWRDALPLVACLLVVALGAAVLGATGALATHENERTTEGFKAYTPGGEIPNPGDEMSVELYMVPAHMEEEGPIPPDVEVRVDYKVYYTTTMSDCDTQDVYALGVDRANDDPHTEYDEDLVQSLMANGDTVTDPSDDPGLMTTNDDWTHRQYSWLEMADPEDWPQELILHRDGVEDESIVATEECVEMPEPGWHRTFGMINGTILEFHGDRDSVTIDGEELEEGDRFEVWEPSLWYPVCHCEVSRHVAMELDPPPGEMTRGSEGGIIHPNGTMEVPYGEVNESGWLIYPDTEVPPEHVTSEGIHFEDGFMDLTGPMYYAEGRIEADGTIVTPAGERFEPDDDEAPPTPEPDDEGDDDGDDPPGTTPTPTQADDGGADAPAGDSTPTPTPEDDDADPSASEGTPTEEPDRDDGVGATPTMEAAPGFGPVVAILVLFAVGLRVTGRR